MKEIDKKIKRRIGALATLTLLVTILLYPAITAVTIPPGLPMGDRILMEDDEWIGNYHPANNDPTGNILFDHGNIEPEIELRGARVAIGTPQPHAKLHIMTDHVTEIDQMKTGVIFEQMFQPTPVGNNLVAVNITPQWVHDPGDPLARYTALYIESPFDPNDWINKHAIITDPNAGNIGFGEMDPDEAARVDINGLIKIQGGGPQPGMV